MSALASHLAEYLSARRNLGKTIVSSRSILNAFVRFAEQEEQEVVTADLFIRWREGFGSAGTKTWSMRLGQVRKFALWLQCYDSRHEVPPAGLVSARYQRKRPYIYKDEEVRQIISAAAEIPSRNGIVSISAPILFGILSVTGLRISEAISLDIDDLDLDRGVLVIRRGKGSKGRLVVVEATTAQLLGRYVQRRLRLAPEETEAVFVGDNGRRLSANQARGIFAKACMMAGIRKYTHNRNNVGNGPRIHDLRHTFAVNVMMNAYKAGEDPSSDVLKLSTFLGHQLASATYWYIEAVPELLRLASQLRDADKGEDE